MLVDARWSLPTIALAQQTVAPLAGMLAGVLTGAAIKSWGRRTVLRVVGALSTVAVGAMIPLSNGGGAFAFDLAVAGAAGMPAIVIASVGLTILGTVVADRWHRGHDPARERIAVDADVAA